jgi:phenylalanyl-tRNA synthetase alpha chain
MDAIAEITAYETDALTAISRASSAAELEQVRIEFLGRKQGRLKDVQALVGKVSAEERPVVGKRFNEVRERVTAACEARQAELTQPKAKGDGIDVTLPGVPLHLGGLHPITQTIQEFREIMARLGFSTADGPEIEDERHNFEALNIPADHPARDPLDNFYIASAEKLSGGPRLLRSQTSTVQIRVMETTQPPVRIVSLGRVYRPDEVDATHSCMFHQMEGLLVDRGITMAHLKTVLRQFVAAYLGSEASIRFRPSFFPFTEPSVEVDMRWRGRWLELGGAGMVDPNVLEAVGYDPEEYTGFAFGLGIERFCMQRYGVTDIRRFYDGDVRFLRQLA